VEHYIELAKELKQARLNKISDDDKSILDNMVNGNLIAIEEGNWEVVSIDSFFRYLDAIGIEFTMAGKK
jgi:hypothetical protein